MRARSISVSGQSSRLVNASRATPARSFIPCRSPFLPQPAILKGYRAGRFLLYQGPRSESSHPKGGTGGLRRPARGDADHPVKHRPRSGWTPALDRGKENVSMKESLMYQHTREKRMAALGGLMIIIPIVLILSALLISFADVAFGATGAVVAAVAIIWFTVMALRR